MMDCMEEMGRKVISGVVPNAQWADDETVD